jgi:catechol 2,3-dioxygenase-like lactoylglutathione lyase family enzyme
MTTLSIHHLGLVVAGGVERAGDFYRDAFGATWVVRPVDYEGPGAEHAMGQAGVRFRIGILELPGAGSIELFEFLGTVIPDWARPVHARVPHLALQVENTAVALDRVEAAGGRRLWADVQVFGSAHIVYAADPDGNVIELIDRPMSEQIAMLHSAFPLSRPTAQ